MKENHPFGSLYNKEIMKYEMNLKKEIKSLKSIIATLLKTNYMIDYHYQQILLLLHKHMTEAIRNSDQYKEEMRWNKNSSHHFIADLRLKIHDF